MAGPKKHTAKRRYSPGCLGNSGIVYLWSRGFGGFLVLRITINSLNSRNRSTHHRIILVLVIGGEDEFNPPGGNIYLLHKRYILPIG